MKQLTVFAFFVCIACTGYSQGDRLPEQGPLSISGVYPAFAAFNSNPNYAQPECGIGGVVDWAGKLWYLSYTSHALKRGTDKLFTVDSNLHFEVRPESVGGTHACRMIHRESRQLFLGCYAIDESGKVRTISREALPGRLTAIARHLEEPDQKVLYYTQECSLYEVDVETLEAKLLAKKPLPGWHAKGAATSQGVLVVSHNGEEPAPSPFWTVDYRNLEASRKEVRKYLKTEASYGPEDMGVLGEWDGKEWKVIRRNQYVEVTTPGGIRGASSPDDPIWATGWDKRSLLLSVREAGRWKHYRWLKPSYSLEGPNGSYTEWPRIREAGEGDLLAFMNGGLYDFPCGFRHGNIGGLRPVSSLLRTVTDWTTWKEGLVLSSQETSVHGVPSLVNGQCQSNLLFTTRERLVDFGPPIGWGGVWVKDLVKAGTWSDALLIAGYRQRTLHLANDSDETVTFTIEKDIGGSGAWSVWKELTVSPHGYLAEMLPMDLEAEAIRFSIDHDATVTAYVHAYSPEADAGKGSGIFQGMVKAGAAMASEEILRPGFPTRDLQYLVREPDGTRRYYQVDEMLKFKSVEDDDAVQRLESKFRVKPDFSEDEASIVVTRFDGQRFRLPKSPLGAGNPELERGIREVVQERYLANLGGTFYEVPRFGVDRPKSARNLPDFIRMKPVVTHGLSIKDFCTWRGLLVLAGVRPEARPDEHVFRQGEDGLWFGAIDDLWKLGKPVGIGGPWFETQVRPGEPSDPYLMTGFDRKTLTLRHDSSESVRFVLEVDFLAIGSWFRYRTLEVSPGQEEVFAFPEGFSAHWARLVPERKCKATASFVFE